MEHFGLGISKLNIQSQKTKFMQSKNFPAQKKMPTKFIFSWITKVLKNGSGQNLICEQTSLGWGEKRLLVLDYKSKQRGLRKLNHKDVI